jgi:hypothetical protein
MVAASSIANNRELWKDMIGSLVREVVSSVDPDVRGGDGMDIRQYVKIKIIPGEYYLMLSLQCVFNFHGIFFRWIYG